MGTRRWSFDRPQPGERPLGYVLLTFRIHEEAPHFVGVCEELGISSFGGSIESALAQTMEAVTVYLETLDEVDERDRVFAECGVRLVGSEPGDEVEVPVSAHPGEVVSPQRLVLADA